MAIRTILYHHESECENCGEKAVLVSGNYEEMYHITRKPFWKYAQEQLEEGENILNDSGCQKCNPLR